MRTHFDLSNRQCQFLNTNTTHPGNMIRKRSPMAAVEIHGQQGYVGTFDTEMKWRKIKETLIGELLQRHSLSVSPLVKPFFPELSLFQIRGYEIKWTVIAMKSNFTRFLIPDIISVITKLLHSVMIEKHADSSFESDILPWLYPETYMIFFEHMIFRSMYREDNFVGI